MIKKTVCAFVIGIMLAGASSVSALELDALVGLDERGNTGRFFHPLMNDVDLIVGFSGFLPFTKSVAAKAEVGVTAELGVGLELPILGRTNITTNISKSKVQGSQLTVRGINISKNYLYSLTDQVKIGLTLVLAKAHLQAGDRNVDILPSIYPVIGATIDLF